MTPSDRCAFGDYVLDRKAHAVRPRAGGEPLALTPKQFDALLLLVERPNELLAKDALIAALWPGLVVEENNLSQVIAGLRRALGDDAQVSRYIQTVPRRGFRFVAPVAALDTDTAEAGPDAQSGPSRASRRGWLLGATGAALAAAGTLWWRQRAPAPGTPAPRPTLAVLPFKPLVAEGRDELLEIGMADSLIARLSTVPGLVVRSVGSVRRFAGADQDPLRAGHELDVAWIVDGSLQRRGAQWRVSARLLQVTDGVATWSGSFDESASGVFEVQDQISTRVAAALAPWLVAAAPVPAGGTAAGGTRNPDAYQHYLAARHHAQGIRAAGLRRSAELYRKAIDADPGYALAYAGLVETYRRMIFGADVAPSEVFAPAEVAAQRALALAPELAEAHAGQGWIRFWYHFDWNGAERLFRHALSLNPNTVEAHFGLGLLLLSLDRPAEGLAHLSSARQLDPMSLILNALEAAYQLAQGHRDEAEKRLARAFEIDTDFWVAHLTQATLYLADRKVDAAIASLRRADALADGSTQAAALLGALLARNGRADQARQILQRFETMGRQRYVPPTSQAALHAALGNVPAALDALEQAYAVRDTRLVYMKDDERWATLRQEPRYVALLQRMKLDRFGSGRAAN
jgi:DNA-binding winged helix-turn-helix (wHTH) protein/TolB-like protein/tetratricopeptide (TPR) repeat protein